MTTLFDDFKNAFNRYDNGHIQLVLINVSVFVLYHVIHVFLWMIEGFELAEAGLLSSWLERTLALPASFSQLLYQPWSIISYFFFHQGFFHILSNMLMLYWFGMILTEFIGSKKLIHLYVLGGIVAGLFYMIAYNVFPSFRPYVNVALLLGASGAVYAVIVGAATLVPNYTVRLFLIGNVKIIYIAGAAILLSFIEIKGSNPGGNIAHLSGALMGFVYIKQLQAGNDLGRPVGAFLTWVSNLFSKIGRRGSMNISYKSKGGTTTTSRRTASVSSSRTTRGSRQQASSQTNDDFPTQEEIDRILDKISVSGYESLTKGEKQRLFSASQK